MEVIKSMETAIDKCEAGDDSKVHSWDEAVAFYTGSMAKESNGDEGEFLYTNAKKRCRNFGTCDDANEAQANTEIFERFMVAQRHLFVGECEEVKLAKDRIANLMSEGSMLSNITRCTFPTSKTSLPIRRAAASMKE